jgi:hypothetical protein
VFSLSDFHANWYFLRCLILFHSRLLVEQPQDWREWTMARMEFRSPLRKLMVFFKTSRDKWKEKCQESKYQAKLLKRRLDNLRINCDQWQQRCQQAEARCEELRARGEHLQAQVDAILKKGGILS